MKTCITCGMPLEGEHAEDIGLETPDGLVCVHDSIDGHIRDADEIFKGGVKFFLHGGEDGAYDLAERIVRRNMKALPYWQAHPFELLDGEEASDEEFAEAMRNV